MNTKFSKLSFTIAVSAAMIAGASVASPTVVSFSDASATSTSGSFVADTAISRTRSPKFITPLTVLVIPLRIAIR